jgi:hypothetical protein
MNQYSIMNDLQLKRKHLERQNSIDFDESTTLGLDILYENNLEEEFEKKTTLISVLESKVEKIETESSKDEKRNKYASEIEIIRRAIDGPVLNYCFSGQKF